MSNELSHTHGRIVCWMPHCLDSELMTCALCITQAVTSYDIKTCLLKHLDSEVRLLCVMNCIFLYCTLKFFAVTEASRFSYRKQRLLVFLCHHFWIALIKLVYLCIYYSICIEVCCFRRHDFKICF